MWYPVIVKEYSDKWCYHIVYHDAWKMYLLNSKQINDHQLHQQKTLCEHDSQPVKREGVKRYDTTM